MMLTPGTILQNRYRIVSVLGQQGAMSTIYRAWHLSLKIPVAVKELASQKTTPAEPMDQRYRQFQEEALTLARLDHPNLVDVLDYFAAGDKLYLVMRFVEGESLHEHIARQGPVPETQVLDWAGQLLGALAYCHEQQVIHRDIKPQNIIIQPDGKVVLVDFGLVKLWDPADPVTRTIALGMGTPEYAPPEQYETQPGHTGPWSDIYSLGATLYHALTGQAPPTASRRMAIPEQFRPVRDLRPEVSEHVAAAIQKAMALRSADRFPTAGQMRTALEKPAPQRKPALIAGLALIIILVITGGVWLILGNREEPKPTAEAVVSPTGAPTQRPTRTPQPSPTESVAAIQTATPLPTLTPTVPPSTLTPTPATTGNSLIAYEVESGDIWSILLIRPSGQDRRFLTGVPENSRVPGFSPVDGKVAFRAPVEDTWQIFTVWPDGRELQQVTTPPGNNLEPVWSPDGQRFAFVSDRDGQKSIYVMDVDGGNQVRLTNPANQEDDPAWSPDGQWIVFESDQAGRYDIYKIRPDGRDLTRLTFDRSWNATPSWSPDGNWIAFESGSGNQAHIWIMRPDGSDQRQLTATGTVNHRPAWAPDSGQIAFTSNRSGEMEIWIMAADGTEAQQLTYESGAYNAAWSR